MTKRKPRSRKSAAAASPRRRVGPLWWGAGLLALGWIAFDANRPVVERHLPALAALRLPWEAAPAPPARRVAASERTAAPRPASPRPAAARSKEAERPAEPRQAALRPPASPMKPGVPETRPAHPAPAPARPVAAPSQAAAPTAAPSGAGLVTRAPVPLRRAPQAGAPVWMVLDAGRPLRVTRREGAFARVESGIFTGWVDAAVLPPAAAPPAGASAPATRSTMPTLAAAGARRAGPTPAAGVPGAR